MELDQLRSIVEVMIFVSDEPLSEQAMLEALESDGVEKAQLKETIEVIRLSWNENPASGLELAEIAGGYQFRTKEGLAEWARRIFEAKPVRLSQPSLETLAIIGYRQPITRSEIEHIRGVDCGGVLKTLIERRLIKVIGKRDEPGQPLIYGTAKEFLETFNLASLKDLPALTDLKDLLRQRDDDSSQPQIFGLTGSGLGDDEEDEEEEEEPTEVISRVEEEDDEDREALANLEGNLKGLRRLERAIFPKPTPKVEPTEGGTEHAEGEPTGEDKEGTPEQVDRTGE